MLTTCPNCLHVFHTTTTNNSNHLQHEQHRLIVQPQQFTPLPSSSTVHFTAPCCESSRQQQPLLVSLQLPPTNVSTTCTVAVSTTNGCEQHMSQRVLAGMTGGGIVQTTVADNPSSVIQHQSTQDEKLVFPPCSPQSSPSAPLSFLLPSAPNVFTTTRPSTLLPLQWTVSTAAVSSAVTTSTVHTPQQWALPSPTASPWYLGLQMPPAQQIPQVAQSDTDLVRLAATLKALRTSGWYYDGLSWQESAEALQSTSPGTFLVRDSSDPRFLFSLSVQTERGPTSVRLHYVCGQFRLDAEPRLAPLMPLFECVVRLVEYYIDATKDTVQASGGEDDTKRNKDSQLSHKGQVWVDARGRMYSHVLLKAPLYKKQQLPSLQHLARLAINRSLKAAGAQQFSRIPSSTALPTSRLPLPTLLTDYLREYPYTH